MKEETKANWSIVNTTTKKEVGHTETKKEALKVVQEFNKREEDAGRSKVFAVLPRSR